ncbi:beta-glucosidase [Amycolatopsis orientalis]|uniref:Beta-glucosidase n=1 Tax=Amycolatopsis orientalis TaxID=31958 RepID=A0A193BUP8_AMYOR|nr:GH1 family beta-glucosidase [Amycolatopsis orientalis]ANN15946.1 beta-glucosidase [Amycolatopsis orientalis]
MNDAQPYRFPPDFRWGVGTSAFQIEGGVTEDGRGRSVWDTFTATEGKIHSGHVADVACDHLHRYEEDFALIAGMGIPGYRFSISWPRVMPDGRTLEARGLGAYDRMVDAVLDRGITPSVTLYHWDLPQALEDDGGWPARDTAYRFADYAALVQELLGDRVDHWTTVNEPFCAAFLGYGTGLHAPGHTDEVLAMRAAHHLMLAHGLAMQALRAGARPGQEFGLALNFAPALVDVDDERHREARRKFDGLHNRFFLDPALGRGYPEDVLADSRHLGDWTSVIHDGDLETIAQPMDWLGVNYYAPARVTPLEDVNAVSNCGLPSLRGVDVTPPRGPLTSIGWEQSPDSLTDLLVWLHKHTGGLPTQVLENGAAFEDRVDEDGRIRDIEREQYLHDHLHAIHAAIEAGAYVRGYVVWSLLDNFEWSLGYSQRFGLVRVDFDNGLRRTVKDSARYYARVIEMNALPG